MKYTREDIIRACENMLHKLEGSEAKPRKDQIKALEYLLLKQKKTLLIQPVGWGKSLVYWVAAELLRQADEGLVVIVSPLLALMMDQLGSSRRAELNSQTWNSTNVKQHKSIHEQVLDDQLDTLILTPEQLLQPGFMDLIQGEVSLVVIDEAHCISQWGYSFRSDYLRIGQAIKQISGVKVLATTATANDQIEKDIVNELGGDVKVLRGPLENPSIDFSVVSGINRHKQAQFLDKALKNLPNGGLIYAFTEGSVRRIAAELGMLGHKVEPYYGELKTNEKRLLETRWHNNEYKALVCTSALGMGIDKKDVPFVFNVGIQPSITDYFQQAGRGGRNGNRSIAALIPDSSADKSLIRHQPTFGLPNETDMSLLYETLRNNRYPMEVADIITVSKTDHPEPLKVLKLLASQNAIDETQDGWYCIDDKWTFDSAKHEAIIAYRTEEIDKMLRYTTTDMCLEHYLRENLGDTTDKDNPCGRCSNCTGELPDELKFDY